MEPTISPELRQKSAKDVCEYLYPKRKAVERSIGDIPEELLERLDELRGMSDEELRKIMKEEG